MNKTVINFSAFLELVGKSFKYVFKNKALIIGVLPLTVALIILQLIINMPFVCILQELCYKGTPLSLTILALLLGSAGVIINYCRSIINKAPVDFSSFSFWKKMIYYLLASVLLGGIFYINYIICVLIVISLIQFAGWSSLILPAVYLCAFMVFIVYAPLFLAFPAIAVENYKLLNPKKLFAVAKGNHNAIFWGQFSIMIPYWIFLGALKEIYNLVPQSYLTDVVFMSLLVVLSVMDACFKGAFFAHIYQMFVTNKDK